MGMREFPRKGSVLSQEEWEINLALLVRSLETGISLGQLFEESMHDIEEMYDSGMETEEAARILDSENGYENF